MHQYFNIYGKKFINDVKLSYHHTCVLCIDIESKRILRSRINPDEPLVSTLVNIARLYHNLTLVNNLSHLTYDDEHRGEAAGLFGGRGLAADGGEAVGLHPVVDQHVEGGEEGEGNDAGE